MKSLSQHRAEFALRCIDEVERAPSARDEYVRCVEALPAEILINALDLALLTLQVRAGAGREARTTGPGMLFRHVEQWLCRELETSPYYEDNAEGRPDLLRVMATRTDRTSPTADADADYRCAHREALAFLDWLKRLAVARLKRTQPDGPPSDGAGGENGHGGGP